MLGRFFNRQPQEPKNPYAKRCDLSTPEKEALDKLGAALPQLGGQKLSLTFDLYLTQGWRGHHQIKGDTGETITKYALYHEIEDSGYERVPRIDFYHSPTVHQKLEDHPVHIVFMPGYLLSTLNPPHTTAFVPHIIKTPDDIASIACPVTRTILEFAKNYNKNNLAPQGPQP